MKQDSKITQIKAKGKLDHGNQQQPKQKCPMEDCNHNNKTRQQCSTRDRQKVCDENLITEPTGPGFV